MDQECLTVTWLVEKNSHEASMQCMCQICMYQARMSPLHIQSTYCPSNLEKWPIKFDIGLTNGLLDIRSYFVLCKIT